MSRDHAKQTRHASRDRGDREVGDERTPSFGASLQRAVSALTGDSRQVRAFQADPARFLTRHHIDVRQPAGAGALAALSQLTEAPAASRAADPSGEAHAADSVVVAPSAIEGEGLFAGGGMPAGSTVCDVGVGDQVSHPASKVNQSNAPNTEMVVSGGQMVVTTVRTIKPGEELVANYPLLDPATKANVKVPPPRSG